MIEVGKKVYVLKTGDNARYYRNNKIKVPIEEHVVGKVGRKYFYLDGSLRDIKFCLKSNRHVTEFSSNWKVYESRQAIEDELELNTKIIKIKDFFRYGVEISIEDVRKIYDIINKEGK